MTQTIEFALQHMDAWAQFAQQNKEALTEQYGSLEKAFRHAIDGGLYLGGGAAPFFHVYFEE